MRAVRSDAGHLLDVRGDIAQVLEVQVAREVRNRAVRIHLRALLPQQDEDRLKADSITRNLRR